MRTLSNILRDIDELCNQLENIRFEIEEWQFDIPEKEKVKLFEKHVLLAIRFGVLEAAFNRVATLDQM